MPKSAALRIVYVVDGDASVREGMSRLMDSAGLEARPCASVPEFLDQARGMHVACVLLDIWGARQCEMPVIALSSSDDPAARQLARELGAQSFFRKPVDAAALLDAIEWVMQGDGRSPPN